MRLSRLLEHTGVEIQGQSADGRDPEITSLHYRAQEVRPGGLFVAMQGMVADGHDFISQAFSLGAAAVVAQRRTCDDSRLFLTPDTRAALAHLAAAFYGDPSAHLTLVGITGTNGKTTVTYLVESILEAGGLSAGVVGTNNCRFAGEILESKVTTPESLDLQEILSRMQAAGVTHAVMEVSSHGVDLKRVDACRFDAGAFTNLTQDHLDYHGNMDAYWECKKRFFTDHLFRGPKADRAVAVVNTDNLRGQELGDTLAGAAFEPRLITYGRDRKNRVRVRQVSMDIAGTRAEIETPGGAVEISSRLVGGHNLENILCAVAIGVALKLPLTAIKAGIDAVANVPGRLERVEDSRERMVFVDYAHTPDALENVLGTLKGVARRRIICVFGCGGDRDRGKRPLMGRIAAKRSDLAVVTSDNPRTEEPLEIIRQIVAGVKEEMTEEFAPEDSEAWTGARGFMVVPDRSEAIRRAIRTAQPGDVVLIAGKGHETYQLVGKEKRDFDDRQEAAVALKNLK
jgi:UDP-N-acetylmuramoyl-L-alanyl-D-glutamate--2,6-diaminopimelate ligase/murE/murF fusion protein